MNAETCIKILNGVGWHMRITRNPATAYSIQPFTGYTPVTNRKYLNHCHKQGWLSRVSKKHRPGIMAYTYHMTADGWRELERAERVLFS